MSIITYPLNGIDYGAEEAETYLCTRISGIYASEGHFDVSVTGDREVTVGPGLAWIRNTDHSGKSIYNDSAVALTVPVADGALPRIDRVVIRFLKSNNASEIALKQGTPASSPVPPELSRTELNYELGLCTINIGASSVTLSDGDITSTVMDEDVCGLMRDGVTGIPTAQLYQYYNAWYADIKAQAEEAYGNFTDTMHEYERAQTEAFDEWFESIKDILSGDVAGNLELLIEEAFAEIGNLRADIVKGTVCTGLITEDGRKLMTEDGRYLLGERHFK